MTQHQKSAQSTSVKSSHRTEELPEILKKSIKLAEEWQEKSNAQLRPEEKAHQKKMSSLLKHPVDKIVFSKMIDQSFRAHSTDRIANQLTYILKKFGVPRFFSPLEMVGIRLLMTMGSVFHFIMIPVMVYKMRQDSSAVILPGEKPVLYRHLQKRKTEMIRMNVNQIGEAMLGESDARARFENYEKLLRDPNIEYISIKISTIYSQIDHVAHAESIRELESRLAKLYLISQENEFVRPNGQRSKKFVNLDMEEFKDLELTKDLFVKTLSRPELKSCSAGIVLQAYLPDSFHVLQELTGWAKARVADGGAPIKVRIVKGANMEMEKLESSHRGWPLSPYDNKLDVDANYKRMVRYAMQPDNIKAVNLGIASHNLFELAYSYVLAKENGVQDYFVFEMLEGMALHVTRVIREVQDVLLYAPFTEKEGFINAIAYLIRRLDENTGPENFLRHSFDLKVGTPDWDKLKNLFIDSYFHMDVLKDSTFRHQNRLTEQNVTSSEDSLKNYKSESDTDWSLAANQKWAEMIRAKWRPSVDQPPMQIPLVVAGLDILHERETREALDRSAAPSRHVVTQYRLATIDDVNRAVEVAKADPDGWRTLPQAERNRLLLEVANELRNARAELVGASMLSTAKIIHESDPEISEAIDFAEFYPRSMETFTKLPGVKIQPKGVGVVVPPWNFPVAIPAGGLLGSLAAGNTVIMKPSSEAVVAAYEMCQAFWRAGVSKNVLQFLPCQGSTVGSRLVQHPDVDFVILTGGTETGLQMLKDRPNMFLCAETGGKNATIVSAMSDRDAAIKDVLGAAFSNAGQKCSCTSLFLLQREVFEDLMFRATLKDAVESMKVGIPWDFQTKVGPLIAPPKGDLKRGIDQLEPGEFWLVEPKMVNNNPYLWSPGIRWNVQPGSFTHMNELFGPVLSVICYDTLEEAIDIVNQTGFGLTTALESLDERELAIWKEKIKAGNLYVNRGTTGAIVLRQPFGGMGKSGFGMGMKAGGLNYVAQFMKFTEVGNPSQGTVAHSTPLVAVADQWEMKLSRGQLTAQKADIQKAILAIRSYAYNIEQEFSKEHDYFELIGQDNIVRYRSLGTIVTRVTKSDSLFDVIARVAATHMTQNSPMVSLAPDAPEAIVSFLNGEEGKALLQGATVVTQSDAELTLHMPRIARIRYAAPDRVPAEVFKAAAETGFYISREPVLSEGRVELLQYIREQSLSINYHRYGNVGERALPEFSHTSK